MTDLVPAHGTHETSADRQTKALTRSTHLKFGWLKTILSRVQLWITDWRTRITKFQQIWRSNTLSQEMAVWPEHVAFYGVPNSAPVSAGLPGLIM